MGELTAPEKQANLNLRRCILSHLYTWFKAYPRAAIELHQLHEECESTAKVFNWNLVYLEKKGWIELDTSAECPPYVACTTNITGTGIDLVEDTQAFAHQFGTALKKE